MVTVFAQVQNAVVICIFTRVQPAVGVGVFGCCAQNTIAVQVFGEIFEARTQCEVDRGRPEQLQTRIDDELGRRIGNGPVEGVDVDLNILSLDSQDVGVNAHQTGKAHTGLGRYKFGYVGIQAWNHVEEGRLHDRQTEINIIKSQANRAFVDVIWQTIGNLGACVGIDAAHQIRSITVGPTHTGKAREVGASQSQGFDT